MPCRPLSFRGYGAESLAAHGDTKITWSCWFFSHVLDFYRGRERRFSGGIFDERDLISRLAQTLTDPNPTSFFFLLPFFASLVTPLFPAIGLRLGEMN